MIRKNVRSDGEAFKEQNFGKRTNVVDFNQLQIAVVNEMECNESIETYFHAISPIPSIVVFHHAALLIPVQYIH